MIQYSKIRLKKGLWSEKKDIARRGGRDVAFLHIIPLIFSPSFYTPFENNSLCFLYFIYERTLKNPLNINHNI